MAAPPPPLPTPAAKTSAPIDIPRAVDGAGNDHDGRGRRNRRDNAPPGAGRDDDRALVALAKDRALAAAGLLRTPPLPCPDAAAVADAKQQQQQQQPCKVSEPPPPSVPLRGGVRAEIERWCV